MFKTLEELSNYDRSRMGLFYAISPVSLEYFVEIFERELADKLNFKPIYWLKLTGAEINSEYLLTGKRALPDDLIVLAFPYDGIDDLSKLAVFMQKCDFPTLEEYALGVMKD